MDENKMLNRRGFFKKSALLAMAAAVGGEIPFVKNLPGGLVPVAMAGPTMADLKVPGKSLELVVLGDKPLVAETPPHLLDAEVTPNELMFIRNNGLVPQNIDASKWTLTIGGDAVPNSPARASESTKKTVTFTIAELKSKKTVPKIQSYFSPSLQSMINKSKALLILISGLQLEET